MAEVEARGIHRAKACASLYTYCIYELRFSEDAAFRRVSAARWVRAFPALFDAVAGGELHLTGVLMIGPHLTPANQEDVLARARHRTKKELAKLVRELDPLPDVPARIAPLGPAPANPLSFRSPTWAEYVAAMVPVRHLRPDERPRAWIDESVIAEAFERSLPSAAEANDAAPEPPIQRADDGLARHDETTQAANDPSVDRGSDAAPPRVASSTPQRYGVQFTASQAYVDLVERARALLSHAKQRASLEELHLRAMQLFVAQLERKKYGAPSRNPPRLEERWPATSAANEQAVPGEQKEQGTPAGGLGVEEGSRPGSAEQRPSTLTRNDPVVLARMGPGLIREA